MRKYYLPIALLFVLSSCGTSQESSFSYEEHNYEEISNLTITYDQSFSISEKDHFIYFYSDTCMHCAEIKNEVIDFALKGYHEMYFVVATEDIPHNHDYSDYMETIGSSDINDVFLGVTPQLALIKNGKIEKNILKPIYIEEELSHYRG